MKPTRLITLLLTIIVVLAPSLIHGQGQILPGQVMGNPTGARAPARGVTLGPLFGIRTRLTQNANFYVSTTGNNANTPCLVQASPCQTIQFAYDTIANGYDLAGFVATINLADGTYTSGLLANKTLIGLAGPEFIQISGNVGNPAAVTISTTSVDAVSNATNGSGTVSGFFITGVTLQTTTSGHALSSWGGGSHVIFGNVRFGTTAGAHIFASHQSFVIQLGNAYAVVGGANGHASASVGAAIALHGATVTFSNSPNLVTFAQAVSGGQLFIDSMTFVNGNTVTGTKFNAASNGVINTLATDINYLPGTNPGNAAFGGYYGNFSVPGGMTLVSADTTLTYAQRTIGCDATTGTKTITLPLISNFSVGITYDIFKTDTSINVCTIVPAGGTAISGANSGVNYLLNQSSNSVTLRSSGTVWFPTAAYNQRYTGSLTMLRGTRVVLSRPDDSNNFTLGYTANDTFMRISFNFGADVLTIDNVGNTTITGTMKAALTTDAAKTDRTVCQEISTGFFFFGSGTAGICLGTSSLRYKQPETVKPLSDGLAQLTELKPINFYYRQGFGDEGKKEQYGFLAEDVFPVLPKLVDLDEEKRPNSVDLLGMTPIMVRAIQQLNAKVDALEKRISQ